MTDENTTTDPPEGKPCLGCGKVHDEIAPEIKEKVADTIAKMDAVEAGIKALDPERRNLLVSTLLDRVEHLIEGAVNDLGTGNDQRARTALLMAAAAVGFANLVPATEISEHEDWTRTSDAKVTDVMTDFLAIVKDMLPSATQYATITPDDVPEDVMRRVAEGTGSEEDVAALRHAISEKTGMPEEDIDVDALFGRTKTANGKVPQAPQSAGFTPRRDAEGFPVDEDGHRYGGTYL